MLNVVAHQGLTALSAAAAPPQLHRRLRAAVPPPPGQASTMFADPSKMQNMDGVPLPSHWYKAPVQIM